LKSHTGKTHLYTVTATGTIAELKKMIMEKEEIPPDQARLIFGGKELKDELKFVDYGIQKDSTLYMVLRQLGGGRE
jgi:hypothetical protein